MKKFFYVLLSAAALCLFTACGEPDGPDKPDDRPEFLDPSKPSSMEVFCMGKPILDDTTIEVTESHEDELSGNVMMEVRGTVSGAQAFRVTIKRSDAGREDELCAGIQCVPGDGELAQDIDYKLPAGQTSAAWYAHYTPSESGVYTVTYSFQNYDRTINLTINYNYKK